MSGLAGRRFLVVGASAGIGRAMAEHAMRGGAAVAVTARRPEKLDEVLGAAVGSTPATAVPGDVTVPGDVRRMVDRATEALGALDLVVYAAGVAPLGPLLTATAEDWTATLATNVVGANLVLAAAVPHMAPSGILAVLSSETVGRPRHGLGIYGASKAALEESMRGWRLEHTGLRFSSIAVGATQPTEFGASFDDRHLVPALEAWSHNGLLQEEFMDTEQVGALLIDTLAGALAYPNLSVDHLLLRSPSPVVGMSTFLSTTVQAAPPRPAADDA